MERKWRSSTVFTLWSFNLAVQHVTTCNKNTDACFNALMFVCVCVCVCVCKFQFVYVFIVYFVCFYCVGPYFMYDFIIIIIDVIFCCHCSKALVITLLFPDKIRSLISQIQYFISFTGKFETVYFSLTDNLIKN